MSSGGERSAPEATGDGSDVVSCTEPEKGNEIQEENSGQHGSAAPPESMDAPREEATDGSDVVSCTEPKKGNGIQVENSGQRGSAAPPESMDAPRGDWVKAIDDKDCKRLMDILSDFGGYGYWSIKGGESRTALHVAAMQGCLELAKQVVDCFLVMCLRDLQGRDLFKAELEKLYIGTMPLKDLIEAMDGRSRDRSALDKAREAIGKYSLIDLRDLFKAVKYKVVEGEKVMTFKDLIEAQDGRSGITALNMAEKFTGNRSITQYLKRVLTILKEIVHDRYVGYSNSFYMGFPGTDWYRALELGDCSTLGVLLQINPRLLLETLPGNVTVLHVAVVQNDKNLAKQVHDAFRRKEAVDHVWEAECAYPSSLSLESILEVKASRTEITGYTFFNRKYAKALRSKSHRTGLELTDEWIRISPTEFTKWLKHNGGSEDSSFQLTQLSKIIGDAWQHDWDAGFEKDVDYNFEPQARLDILRFHYACKHPKMWLSFIERVFSRLGDVKTLLVGLCMFQDGQGRTPYHTWVQYSKDEYLFQMLPILGQFSDFPSKFHYFTNARDGRGRLALQRAITMQFSERPECQMQVLNSILAWHMEKYSQKVVFWPSKWKKEYQVPEIEYLQLAIFLEQMNVVECFFPPRSKDLYNPNLLQKNNQLPPPLFLAALVGNQAILQLLLQKQLKHLDPMNVDNEGRTTLHYAVADKSSFLQLSILKDYYCFSVDDWIKVKDKRMLANKLDYYDEKRVCINMLLQVGVDLRQADKGKKIPNPNPNAPASFQIWWHERLATNTMANKNSFNEAGSALAVVGALVVATSYIGPLQPPMNYMESGHAHMSEMAVRVFMVNNTLAFYLAIASVMFAVVPSLPMPQESLLEELKRARHMVASSLFVLLLSIVCVIVSFGAASIVVIENEHSFSPLDLLFWPTLIGGLFCVVAILNFFIRLLRLVFFRSPFIRALYQFSIWTRWKLWRVCTINWSQSFPEINI